MFKFVLAVTALLWAGEAAAQGIGCNSAPALAAKLASKFHEEPVAFGLQTNGNLLQVYATEEGEGTWTIVSTTPNGMSCVMAAGKRWETLPRVVSDQPT